MTQDRLADGIHLWSSGYGAHLVDSTMDLKPTEVVGAGALHIYIYIYIHTYIYIYPHNHLTKGVSRRPSGLVSLSEVKGQIDVATNSAFLNSNLFIKMC